MKLFNIVFALAILGSAAAQAADPQALLEKVSARADADRQQATMTFILRSANGQEERRQAKAYSSLEKGTRKVAMYFSEPKALKGTAFLADNTAGTQHLYMPALRNVRQVPAADRGAYFMGTDLTYDDVRSQGRIRASDYRFESAVAGPDGSTWIKGATASPAIAKELGYGKAEWLVDAKGTFVQEARYFDPNGAPLKNISFEDIRAVDGVMTAHKITVKNVQSGRSTILQFSEVNNKAVIAPAVLSEAGLKSGSGL